MKKSSNQLIRNALALAVLASLATSCATGTVRMYSGRNLPPDEVAIIENRAKLLILSVDKSRLVEDTTIRGKYAKPRRIEVLPGTHEVIVALKLPRKAFGSVRWKAVHTQRIQERKLKVDVEAGHTYVTTQEIQTSPFFKWTPAIVDITEQ
jgi:hypothetical protein